MPGTRYAPGRYDWIVTRGDTVPEVDFNLTLDGSPWTVDSAVAQVRSGPTRGSTLVLTLTDVVATGKVTIGGNQLTSTLPGDYFWDLEVTDGTDVTTIVAGKFTVLNDITHVTP
jgi:hypothetical protein